MAGVPPHPQQRRVPPLRDEMRTDKVLRFNVVRQLLKIPPVSPTAQTLALVTQLMLVIKLMVGINLALIHSTLLARAPCGQQITAALLLNCATGPLRRVVVPTLTTCARTPVHCTRRTTSIVRTALVSGAWRACHLETKMLS